MAGIICDDLDCIMLGDSLISEVWAGDELIWQYDSTAPTLVVDASAGTGSGSPTYTTAGTYRVSGAVTDADSGVAAVYVNGEAAIISGDTWYKDISLTAETTAAVQIYAVDKAGNQTGVITRYVRYDSAAPALAVTAPTGTAATSPAYYQSDAAVSYTVSGTVSDSGGIASVTVNGAAASVSSGKWSKALSLATNTTHTIKVVATDNAGRTTTVNRYIRVEAFYQQAARTAGTTVQASLDATLRSSAVCAAIAANATAYGIMKSKYSSSMKTYIDSYWSEGLNALNFACKLKCYVYNAGNQCTAISGGWVITPVKRGSHTPTVSYGNPMLLNATEDNQTAILAATKTYINMNGYTYLKGIGYKNDDLASGYLGIRHSTDVDSNGFGAIDGKYPWFSNSSSTLSIAVAGGGYGGYGYAGVFCKRNEGGGGMQAKVYCSKIWLE